jgi:hypothetical protein
MEWRGNVALVTAGRPRRDVVRLHGAIRSDSK